MTIYIISGAIAFAAVLASTYYIWRWIFSIKRQLWNQKQQLNVLLKIAEKLGVDPYDKEMMYKLHEQRGKYFREAGKFNGIAFDFFYNTKIKI